MTAADPRHGPDAPRHDPPAAQAAAPLPPPPPLKAVTFPEACAELAGLGYLPGGPDGPAAAHDSAACRESECSRCGCQGLRCYPYYRPGSYRALAVCPVCADWFEL